MDQTASLKFAHPNGTRFCLEIFAPHAGHPICKLYKDEAQIGSVDGKPIGPKILDLLWFLAERAQKPVRYEDLRTHVFSKGEKLESSIYGAVRILQRLLDDSDKPHKLLVNLEQKREVTFTAGVTRDGDFGNIVVHPEWTTGEFDRFLREIEPSQNPQEPLDLCLSTVGFMINLDDIFWRPEARRRLHHRVLLLNPWNEALIETRFALRLDIKSLGINPQKEIFRQIRKLHQIQIGYEKLREEDRRLGSRRKIGSLEWRLSDSFPCGFLALAREKAMFGLFTACHPYTEGPIIEMQSCTKFWILLNEDWHTRWDAALPPEEIRECAEMLGLVFPSKTSSK